MDVRSMDEAPPGAPRTGPVRPPGGCGAGVVPGHRGRPRADRAPAAGAAPGGAPGGRGRRASGLGDLQRGPLRAALRRPPAAARRDADAPRDRGRTVGVAPSDRGTDGAGVAGVEGLRGVGGARSGPAGRRRSGVRWGCLRGGRRGAWGRPGCRYRTARGAACRRRCRRWGCRLRGRGRRRSGFSVVEDYLAEEHAASNARHLASGTPWVLVKASGAWPMFGPVFRPGEGGACWACLAHRLRGNDEVGNFLRNTSGDASAVAPGATPAVFVDAVLGLAAVEIARWVVVGEASALHDHVLSLALYELTGVQHPVSRRPQCAACGDAALRRPDRVPPPVVLGPSPKPVRNSGGVRSVAPEETVRKYRHLVSPVSGVVTQLMRTTAPGDDWLHVYWAGSNLALRTDSLYLLRTSLRTKSSGKGSTAEQAEASALCEAVERYSGVYHGDEVRRRARYEDFAAGEALHPNEVMLYSDRQYGMADEINARRSRFNYVPARFDPAVEMDWTPVWSRTAGRHRWFPTAMLYFAAPVEDGVVYCGPDSNGCAAGNTLTEAVLQGLLRIGGAGMRSRAGGTTGRRCRRSTSTASGTGICRRRGSTTGGSVARCGFWTRPTISASRCSWRYRGAPTRRPRTSCSRPGRTRTRGSRRCGRCAS